MIFNHRVHVCSFTRAKKNETDKWFGIVTLLSETDLSGIWLRLVFDRPSLQLGNWFGEVKTTDNQEYLIKNRNFRLKANVPQTIGFYVQPSESNLPWLQGPSSPDKPFPGDFNFFNQPKPQDPVDNTDINSICGIIAVSIKKKWCLRNSEA
ncbi:hypothetical protein ILUMI_23356 [Ignelater luminosus]|uniref:Serine protease gd N-terminal domain-containing protein n=1 Tax=Ignelater luminosus TaxID=2038154 RepID=A0A8K0CB46_IGNLU|nr:hypothetical protein ILUMI_23356 [Ignelater luminosus]